MPAAVASRYLDIRPGLLRAEELREFCRLRPARSLGAIAGEWAGIAAGIALYEWLAVPWLYPLLVVWLGARMLGLWVLAHDGLHRLVLRDPKWNDRVTRGLLAWPIFVGLGDFRATHTRHHQHLKTPDDPESELAAYPDFRFPKSRGQLAAILLLDLSGVNFVRFFLKKRARRLRGGGGPAGAGGSFPLAKLAYYGLLLAAVAALGAWRELLLFWLIPYATWFTMTLRMRLMAEHLALPESEHFQTRTIVPTAFERWIFIPHHVNYHVEHHLYPAIPSYQLPRVHTQLRQSPEFAALAPERRGYLRVFREFAAAS